MINFLNKKFLIILVTLLIAVGFSAGFYFSRQINQRIQEMQQTTSSQNEEVQIKQPTTVPASTLKTYRNEEWGFEFSYPQNLILKENTFKSYYSKFNLELFTPIEEKRDKTFLVNIVLPEFAERSFSGLEKTTEKVIVDDVSGVKYQYKFNERKETVVILPFNEYRLILGIYYEEYEDVFNQILTSFKFLK